MPVESVQSEAVVIGVAVIEDQQDTREGISLLINRTAGFECRHAYGSMEAALERIGVSPPRVALIDIGFTSNAPGPATRLTVAVKTPATSHAVGHS